MKILVVGLEGAAPELLFGDERLTNLRRLMEGGCYGRLKGVIPPVAVPAWMCMATSRDPGSLGVYGFRNRPDYSYTGMGIVDSTSIQEPAIWDQVAREGKRVTTIGVPPSYPPRRVNGVCVGCVMTPDARKGPYTYPAAVSEQIGSLVGEYPVDVRGFRTERKEWLREQIYSMTRKHFEVARHFLRNSEWEYFQCVEIGLDRLHHGFWRYHDPAHRFHQPGHPYQSVIRDYYLYLDDELGSLLDLLGDDTAILVVSEHGAERFDGGFCVNEWLVREDLLALDEYPTAVTPFDTLSVNWGRTKVWSQGGYCACIFLNVRGREPNGTIDRADYEKFREEIKTRLEAAMDEQGRSLGALVFRPEEVYRTVRNVAPDLIACFGGLTWRAIGSVGHRAIHVQENDTGPDDSNHSLAGSFILAAPNNPLNGEVEGADLLDMAPTLLELGGYDVPDSMQGRSLVSGRTLVAAASMGLSPDEEEIIRERLRGLGYIS